MTSTDHTRDVCDECGAVLHMPPDPLEKPLHLCGAKGERAAFAVWVRYYVETERFDRTQPGFMRHGEWIPVGDGRTESIRFSRISHDEAEKELRRLGVVEDVWEIAKRSANRISFEEGQRFLSEARAAVLDELTAEAERLGLCDGQDSDTPKAE